MRANDIMKLADTDHFDLFLLNKIGEELYILKRMVTNDFPTWNVVVSDATFDECIQAFQQARSTELYPLLLWNGFSTFDLKEISLQGLRIWRESDTEPIQIEEYDPIPLIWHVVQSFGTLQEKTAYLNHHLMNPKVIVITDK